MHPVLLRMLLLPMHSSNALLAWPEQLWPREIPARRPFATLLKPLHCWPRVFPTRQASGQEVFLATPLSSRNRARFALFYHWSMRAPGQTSFGWWNSFALPSSCQTDHVQNPWAPSLVGRPQCSSNELYGWDPDSATPAAVQAAVPSNANDRRTTLNTHADDDDAPEALILIFCGIHTISSDSKMTNMLEHPRFYHGSSNCLHPPTKCNISIIPRASHIMQCIWSLLEV